jgi:hypothetical protein
VIFQSVRLESLTYIFPQTNREIMKPFYSLALLLFLLATGWVMAADDKPTKVMEKSFKAANDLNIKVRVTKPQDLETDLQIIGYFKHKPSGDTVLFVLIDFDKLTGNVITSLRNRGDFIGNELETLAFLPPKGAMKPKQILLVGYGDEKTFAVDVIGRVATVSLREAMRMGVKNAAFAPALFDQGYEKLPAVDTARAIAKAVVLAYDTEKRLQKQGLSKPAPFEEWLMEAGPEHFKDVVAGVTKGIEEGNAEVAKRGSAPFGSK